MPEDADDKDIKTAYRQAALAYHPDRMPEGVSMHMREDAAQTWVEIQEAFAVLSDPEKRAHYDTLLEEMRQSEEPKGQTPHQQSRAEFIFAWFRRYWHYLCWILTGVLIRDGIRDPGTRGIWAGAFVLITGLVSFFILISYWLSWRNKVRHIVNVATVVTLFVTAIFAGFIRVSAPAPTTAAINSRSAPASPSNPNSTFSPSALPDILEKYGFEEMPSACEKVPLNELDSCLISLKADFKKKTSERAQGTHKPVTREKIATSAAVSVPGAKSFTVQLLEPSKDARSAVGPNSIQGWIGVTTTHFGSGGAVVTAVAPGSPAARAGLRPGDVINAVNGVSLRDEDLDKKIAAYKAGSKVRLGYMRDAWALEATVTVGTNAQ